ncbi:MAG: flagellum-specific ATP synthase FliI [Lautropia sp. SCN 70-15]|jgi:flagellum-specific ATP synthase|nr:MAG: flagellum-specific ATP synthase FliI [Lautropia sp. SCN 70-15]
MSMPPAWSTLFENHRKLLAVAAPYEVQGCLIRATGLVLECSGLRLPVGSLCLVSQAGSGSDVSMVEAEVVGFGEGRLYLMPTGETLGLSPGARVLPIEPAIRAPRLGQPSHAWLRVTDRMRRLPIGDGLLGRVVDSSGAPLDRHGALGKVERRPISGRPVNAMEREPIRQPLDTGVRAINAMLTVGRGQRLGLFAGAGVGKSVLLGMMARYTSADVIVLGLIGERGREVKEFIEDILGEDGLRRSVVVAAPSDAPPLSRMQGAVYATAIAEHFRDQGRHVLLLMDSLTRYAMAAREVALAVGEPPATKGYPPSVFARLPSLIERTGNGLNGHGSITAFYTVLTEGDDPQDPVADAARSFLDGHLVLSRPLADAGHYPAIDVEQSISRVMANVVDAQQIVQARRLKSLWSHYQRSRDLISVGAYVPGSDAETDLAIALFPNILRFLQQDLDERCDLPASAQALTRLVLAANGAPAGAAANA